MVADVGRLSGLGPALLVTLSGELTSQLRSTALSSGDHPLPPIAWGRDSRER